jgi:hypothetical protein
MKTNLVTQLLTIQGQKQPLLLLAQLLLILKSY